MFVLYTFVLMSVLLFVFCMSVYTFKPGYFDSVYNCSLFLSDRALNFEFSYFVCSNVCILFE